MTDDPGALPRVAGIVLAAGAGTRYGSPKILAHDGEWLRSAVCALRTGGCDPVLVTMGAAVVEPPSGVEAVSVPQWSLGLAESVRAGLSAVGDRPGVQGVVFHVVDTPDVGPPVVARLLAAAAGQRAALARAVFGGRPGHPVYIGSDHFQALRESLGGDRGAGPYLSVRPGGVQLVECGDLASGLDHDTAQTPG